MYDRCRVYGSLVVLLAMGCSAPSTAGTMGAPRSGSAGNVGSGDSAGTSFDNGDSALPPTAPTGVFGSGADVCASAIVHISKNMPSIVFVIDGSGSMCAPFGESTRWGALRSALLDPDKGLIYRLQDAVRFGATLFDGTVDSDLALTGFVTNLAQNPPCELLSAAVAGKDMGECPELIEAMPAKLNNAQAIDAVFPAIELGGSTPTDKTMAHVMDELIAAQVPQGPDDPAQGPVYVILATDGAPNDICVNGTGGDGSVQRQGVITAVDRGAKAGIVTWVISLADGDPDLQSHLDEVARHGDPSNANAQTFIPTSPDELIMTLARLLGGAVGCHVELDGMVKEGQECMGVVEQAGVAVPCCQQTAANGWECGGTATTTPDGWRLSDPHSIELLGNACTNFLISADAFLTAKFPCAIFTPS